MKKILTAIDLFSGCGGLSQGLKDADFKVLAAVEFNSKARETYSLNHPEVPLVGLDIRHISVKQILKSTGIRKGELDLLAGCPPCQGFSTLRHRNGKEHSLDKRNDLIDEFSRLALGLRPKLIMMENVPGLAKFDKFQSFVLSLKKAGYTVNYKILDVSLYGVPQRRKRLILAASRVGVAELSEPLPNKISVRTAIGNLPEVGESNDPVHDLASKGHSLRIQTLIEAIPKNGGSRCSLPLSMQLNCHREQSGFNDVYGRMKWDDVSPTITSGCTNPSKGRFIHPEKNRSITLREAAILQGFPVTYKFNIAHGKGSVSLMIGNALPPPFIMAHTMAMSKGLRNG